WDLAVFLKLKDDPNIGQFLENLPSQTGTKSTVRRAFAGGIPGDATRRKNSASPFETVTTVLLRHASFDRWAISSVASAAPGGIITPLCTMPDSTISQTFLWNILFDSSAMKRFLSRYSTFRTK